MQRISEGLRETWYLPTRTLVDSRSGGSKHLAHCFVRMKHPDANCEGRPFKKRSFIHGALGWLRKYSTKLYQSWPGRKLYNHTRFISGSQDWLNIHKSMDMINHLCRLKKKNTQHVNRCPNSTWQMLISIYDQTQLKN